MKTAQPPLNYYKDLPEGYKEAYCIDASKKSLGIILNVIALSIAAVIIAGLYIAKIGFVLIPLADIQTFLALFALCVALIAYLVVHELTHGLFYKLLTRQKLRFGFTLTVAYCGLKEGYVNKKTGLLAVLAPLVIHSVWMVLLIVFLPANVWAVMVIFLFALHFSGCIGDMWVAATLIFRFKGNSVLVCDDGPCQRFYDYLPDETASPENDVTEG